MAALIIGVIVAGLGIGALVSAFQNRGTLPELGATSAPAVTPVAAASAPQPMRTLPPTPSPSPVPTHSPRSLASRAPSPVPLVAARPSAPPSAAATATPKAIPAPKATPALVSPPPAVTPLPAAVPSASTRPTLAPPKPVAVVAPPSPLPTLRPTAVPTVRVPATPNPGEAALALVRRYIDDLIAGNESGAYAALGGSSSDRSLNLKEEAFLDKDARITSMRVSRVDGSGATVDAEIASARGAYSATFHVTNGPNGSIINQHDYIKI